ncbi:MAG: NAD(P)-dependent oxidoreductase, partial [Patescibacteria group bacterium]
STYHLINKKTIKKIKRGAHIVNTARGGLIDPEALLLGLETGHIAGAGLDVLEKEEFIKHPEELLLADGKKTTGRDAMENTKVSLFNNILIDHPKVIVTPHNAFNSVEAVERIFAVTIDNINAFMNGRTQNVLINK